jgi:endonuclease/exonuclease/phosphatase (EEP) superfamily protein YafD
MEIRWIVDNALNFAPHGAVLALAVAAYAIFGRHWSMAIASLLIVVVAGAYIARSDALLAHAHECSSEPRLTVATFNVQAGAADLEAFAEFVEARDVDVIVLQEMTAIAAFRASSLQEAYPYSAASRPRWVEIVSKVPLESVGSFHVPAQSEARRIWRVTLSEPVATDLYFLHGMTPRSALHHGMRSDQFSVLEDVVGDASTPAIVLGDMNATVLDPSFSRMLRATGLQTAVDGRRDSSSWPSSIGLLGVRIDHVLQRGFEVCSVERGPSFGSDHRPVVVELAGREGD